MAVKHELHSDDNDYSETEIKRGKSAGKKQDKSKKYVEDERQVKVKRGRKSKSNESSKEIDPETTILNYLETQYRPYSINDIFQNLHKVHNKPTMIKALESLASKNKIIMKTMGKVNVFVANKVELTLDMKNSDKDKEMEEIIQDIKMIEKDIGDLQQDYSNVIKIPDDKALETNLNELSKEIAICEEMIKSSNNSDKPVLSAESVVKIQSMELEITKECNKRVKMVSSYLDLKVNYLLVY